MRACDTDVGEGKGAVTWAPMSTLRQKADLPPCGTTSPDPQFFRKSLYPSVEKFAFVAERCMPGVVVPARKSKLVIFYWWLGRSK